MPLITLEHRRMGELAYDAVRDAILSGQLTPGSRLNQDDLAKRLGVSRAPIRDALTRLEAEGFVQTTARRGLVVAPMTPRELIDIFELRAILDGHSVRLACKRIGETDFARLREIVDRTERLTSAGNTHELVQAHAEFHYGIYAASGNAELERVARNLWGRCYRFRLMGLANAETARLSLQAHRDILQALQERDGDRAATLVSRESQMNIDRLLPSIEETGAAENTRGQVGEGTASGRWT
jgi:DNA-binding GntR family transcriptional regulator